jgi:hypothetical protein
MNDLKLLAGLRSEVPLQSGSRLSDAVIAAIPIDEPERRRTRHGATGSRVPRRALRPLLAGTVAVAVGVGVAAGVELSGSPASHPVGGDRSVAWSGYPTAPWPAAGHPSYGRAGSAAQLIDYMTRAVASAPGRAPKPNEWVVVKAEDADFFTHGPVFGPPDKRLIGLAWYSGRTCGPVLSIPAVPATLVPGKKVTATLSVVPTLRYDCSGGGLGGWKSVSYDYLNSLPTDPAALEQILAGSAGPTVANTRESAIFQAIDELFAGEAAGVVVPAKLSLTLYRVLQQLPGVTFDTAATDLAGRSGIGFAMVLDGYLKREIVIDPDTYTYMGYKDVAIKDQTIADTNATSTYSAGQVLGWDALLGSAIVDKPGQLP